MSSQFSRIDRIAEMMQRKLAEIIRIEIKDPRLPSLLTISAVQVSKDLSHAKVYFTVYDGDAQTAALILNAAAGYLRTALARTIQTRTVPQLHFIFDESIQYGTRLSRLIDEVNPKESPDSDELSAE
jgi:ribosome-binding factor A